MLGEEVSPRGERLPVQNPARRDDADGEHARVFDHEQLVAWPSRLTFVQLTVLIVVAELALELPRLQPTRVVALLVEQTDDENHLWNDVHDAERADAHHEAFELVGFRSFVFHHRANLEDRNEPAEKKRQADQQEDAYGHKNEASLNHGVGQAGVAHAREIVAVDGTLADQGDAQTGRYAPRGEMEVDGLRLDGFVSPFEAGGEEPRESQDHPPDHRGHAKVVDEQERQHAQLVVRALNEKACLTGLGEVLGVADDVRAVEVVDEAADVGAGENEVADGEEEDGPFGIAKTGEIDRVGDDGEQRREKAEDGENADVVSHDVDLVGGEETLIARHPAVQVLIQFVLQIGLIDAILVRTVVLRLVVEFVRADGREKITLSAHRWNEVPVGHRLRVVLACEGHAVGRFVILGRFEARLLGGIL